MGWGERDEVVASPQAAPSASILVACPPLTYPPILSLGSTTYNTVLYAAGSCGRPFNLHNQNSKIHAVRSTPLTTYQLKKTFVCG